MAAAKTYRSTNTRSTTSSTATYSSVSIGTASSDRYVIIGTSGEATVEGGEAFTATCNGNAMSLIVDGFDATAGQCAAIFALLVTTGTTCDIVVTSADTHLNNVTHVWTATGIDGTAAYATASNADDPVNINANVPLGGVAFGCGQFSSTTAITTTGFTEDYDTSFDGDRFVGGSYGPAGSAETPRTFTFDGGTGNAFGCVAVFEEAASGVTTLAVTNATVTFAGQTIAMKRVVPLTVTNAAITFAPQDIGLDVYTPVSVATVTFAGQEIPMTVLIPAIVTNATITFSPQDVTLIAPITVAVTHATMTFSPQDVVLEVGVRLAVTPATVTFSPQDVGASRLTPVSLATVTFAPQDVGLIRAVPLAVEAATITFEPQQISAKRTGPVEHATITFTTFGVTLNYSAAVITAPAGSVAWMAHAMKSRGRRRGRTLTR